MTSAESVRQLQSTLLTGLWRLAASSTPDAAPLHASSAAAASDTTDGSQEDREGEEGQKALARLTVLLRGCVVHGESNSILVVGPRGSGKSRLVRRALDTLAAEPEAARRGYLVVHVSGLVHVDDVTAIRHVARALDPAADGAAPAKAAAAEALPRANLSKKQRRKADESAEDMAGAAASATAPAASAIEGASAAETARALQVALRAGARENSRCLVVVIDEFDLYAHPHQQAFLYALLDHVQSGTTPMAVVGLTCRLDATALLEKRVLSRFSHQQIHLHREDSLDDYIATFGQMLTVPSDFRPARLAQEWNQAVRQALENSSLQAELRTLYDISRNNLRPLQQLAHLVIARASAAQPRPNLQNVYAERVAQAQDTKVAMLLSASALELCLVIALNNLAHRGRLTPNFEMIYDTYRLFANSLQRDNFDFYSRPVALKAFEHLCDMELVRPAEGAAGHVGDAHRPMRLMLSDDQVMEVLDKCASLSTRVKLWGKHHGLLST